jgi:hypothetical protein
VRLPQRSKLTINVGDESEARPSLADPVRLPVELDPLLREARECAIEVINREREVPVGRPQLVTPPIVVERQLSSSSWPGIPKK